MKSSRLVRAWLSKLKLGLGSKKQGSLHLSTDNDKNLHFQAATKFCHSGNSWLFSNDQPQRKQNRSISWMQKTTKAKADDDDDDDDKRGTNFFFAEFLQVFSFKVLTEIAKRIGTRQRPSKLMKRTDLKCKHCKKEIWLSSCAPTFWRYTFWVMLPVTSVWFPRVQATKWFANPYKEGKALAKRC